MHDRRLVIIGGSSGGTSAAFAARRANRHADITVITKENGISRCAIPFVLGGQITSKTWMMEETPSLYKQSDIKFVMDEVISIDPNERLVRTNDSSFPYDSLIIATGAYPFVPPIPGRDLKGAFTVRTIEDTLQIKEQLKTSKSVIIVGGGAIGIEIASALRARGGDIEIKIVEMCDRILPTAFDSDLSEIIEDKLKDAGIEIVTGVGVSELLGDEEVVAVKAGDREIPADTVIFSIGVRSNTELAKNAGIDVGRLGIKTDDHMMTSIKDIYAIGDCAESISLINGEPAASQLATIAVLQGKIAGKNATGDDATFDGVLCPAIMKLEFFDIEIGRTGFTKEYAKSRGMNVMARKTKSLTRADDYPGAKKLTVELVFDIDSEKLIGAQIIGEEGVAGRIDLVSLAIKLGAKISDLTRIKNCFNPPITPFPSDDALLAGIDYADRMIKRIKDKKRAIGSSANPSK